MRVFYSDHLLVPLPGGIRFPMPRYGMLHQRVMDAHLPGLQLLPSEPASDDQLLLVHDAEYLERVKNNLLSERELRRIGFPWSPQLVLRARFAIGETIAACRAALQDGCSANLAGGTHHAYSDHGQGYCVFNDVAVAARVVQQEGLARRVVILDCDVHQGNGTAAIFASDPTVFTFSIHGARNFPFHKEQSDLDVPLPDGAGDRIFLTALEDGACQAVEQAQADLAIFIAGADPYVDDQLGRMTMTKAGLAERDRIILDLCRGAGLPVAIVMGGGYARQVDDVVDIHLETIRLAAQLFPSTSVFTTEMC
jgi:acetoin utilization deacetylase AcuC-like enzyme